MAISVIRLLFTVGDNLGLFFRFYRIIATNLLVSRFPLAKRSAERDTIPNSGCLIRNEGNFPFEFQCLAFAMALLFSFPSDLFA